jgi:hypothetical protein
LGLKIKDSGLRLKGEAVIGKDRGGGSTAKDFPSLLLSLAVKLS